MIINVYWASGKVPVILSDFNETSILLISNFMKIHPVRAELFHADGQTLQGFSQGCEWA